MKTFTVEWHEESYGRAGIEAESLEEALQILRDIRDGDVYFDDSVTWKKENEYTLSFGNLKEVEGEE